MSTTDSKVAFEAAVCEIVPRPLFLLNEDGSYQEIMVQGFWKLWNAAIAHASHTSKEVSGQGCALCGNGIGHDLECKNHPVNAATEAAKATGTACATCKGTGLVDDGEINHYPNGEPYTCGPVKCVKDCPDCTPAARQPAPVVNPEVLKEQASVALIQRRKIQDLQKTVTELRAALAATAAPVEQPHYRMSEKPTAWLHTLPEGKFFNGAFSDNSQIIRDKDEADSECYFHGGTLTPLFTAEWTQAGLDYVNEKADELHKKIVGSQP